MDAPPHEAFILASTQYTTLASIVHIIESIAPLYFLKGISHATGLHVQVHRGHQSPGIRRVLPPSFPSYSTTYVDGLSQSIEMEAF